MLDFIIVGQGIAGSMLSWFLLKENQRVLVIDKLNLSSATHIASGITNPITGRKYVKTWLADELIPFAASTYREFETLFNTSLYHPLSIIKLFDSIKAQNDWSVRCAAPGYAAYIKNEQVVYLDPAKVKNDFGGFEITGGSRLDASAFLTNYRQLLLQRDALLDEEFSFDALAVKDERVEYKGVKAKCIIFCEGANAIENPYFKFLPFQLAKGECLILKIEDFYTEQVINGEVFIMPAKAKDEYYIGSTHEWNYDDNQPSEKGKHELLGNLSTILKSPYQVLLHKAAIRPTVKDRRPFLGFHPGYKNIGIFNGMGTKGISLAPFFAEHFAMHLVRGREIMKEVDIRRFLKD